MANNRRRNRRRKSKRTIMRSLQINEMSGVDVPAQEGAVALIMKRAGVDAADTPEEAAPTRPNTPRSNNS